ncbi:flagellar basal-body MS-ring/collar protein FliF [Psychrobium sp. 1_MG-2023]|uniref:flagellar basal-body MS-ring/collar protein FliF n=1 Tax=Psychrobium sp. 1_MG-2023 TaxID=3062624 RepID=UPI000C33739F|nr:flagellar basal-body MS-ring/collar protein FliF [Psychrobium sp. 1_MG-2023]MDP2559838.1 flagellar basal-body MS-ring/collar protein FliF [Psychrobium sp. 1_MG-2023]PKF59058.1 flagellar basal body M-ring protein FliF [Alteromonadales bacterium alter-6D02]
MAEASNSTDMTVNEDPHPITSAGSNDIEETKTGVLAGLGDGDTLRQVIMILALAICLGIAVMVLFWAQEPEYRPLGKMDTEEFTTTLDFLDQNKLEYKIDGTTIMIAEENYQQVRLALTRAGMANAPANGDDILMQDMGFGVSQRLERERLKHSRERQLSSAIAELKNVARAKVLLAIPKENVFSRRDKKASATVVVTLNRGRQLGQEEVDAIVDIVASGVDGLEPGRVSVADQNGRSLKSGNEDPSSVRNRKEFEQQRKQETEYLEKIDSILIPVVGIGNYTAQVDVAMDFTAVEETQQRYNPDLPAIRSERTMENKNIGDLVGGVAGALSNQPPLESDIPQEVDKQKVGDITTTKNGRFQKEATRNYELDTTISHIRQQVGIIKKLSVSVALDYTTTPAAEGGEPITAPRTQAELSNITRLLQGSIGYNQARGDILEVVTIPFHKESVEELADLPIWEQPWFLRVVKMVLGALVIIVIIFGLVKPMLNRLIYPEVEEEDLDVAEGDLADFDDQFAADTVDMLAAADSDYTYADDGSIQIPDLRKDDDLLRAVRALVSNEPDLSIQVVKNWLYKDNQG